MRINSEVDTKWRDAFGEIHIPETSHCPPQIKKICENILTMYSGLDGVCPTSYNTMSELDRQIMCDYWRRYDGLDKPLGMAQYGDPELNFDNWFIHTATSPEWLRRSREFLCQHRAIFPKQEVSDHAYQASENMRHSVKH